MKLKNISSTKTITMPKSKAKAASRKAPVEEEDSEEEYAPTQASQSQSMTQAQRAISERDKEEVNRRINDVVHYLMIMDQKKLPIKKQDINKLVLKDFNKGFEWIMTKAKERLKNIFGIEVVETDAKPKSYMLINTLDIDSENPHLTWGPEDNSKMGLLMIILSLIFMKGNMMADTVLWHSLSKMGIEPERTHEVFGDTKKLICQEFVRQGYLEYIRQPQSDPPAYDFTWGCRARAETTKKKVLDFVCQVYGEDGVKPDQWRSQWREVEEEEGETVES
ncbi:non-structural maintenance of chromosomes element 3 homolog [Lineus longissimus]|uniref:non-structural maintenance of chromosomes element 3 homolog n=1 Tax=Lineus longissimus TaxID=88925 RepID=UPI002B4E1F67